MISRRRMARQLRIEYPGAVYHVYARGNGRQAIYLDDEDRSSFLLILSDVTDQFNWLCHADCLMGNHYHLEIETPDANLSAGMRILNFRYAQSFNRRHGRVGSLFQGRFCAKLVQKEAYLLALCRYIVLNPVRAGMVSDHSEYAWSSYRCTAGLDDPHPARTPGWVLSQFGDTEGPARREYMKFVSEGIDAARPGAKGVIVGDDAFVKSQMRKVEPSRAIAAIPSKQRFADRPPLREVFLAAGRRRNSAIVDAVTKYGYSQKAVADHVGLHFTRISQIVRAARKGLD